MTRKYRYNRPHAQKAFPLPIEGNTKLERARSSVRERLVRQGVPRAEAEKLSRLVNPLTAMMYALPEDE